MKKQTLKSFAAASALALAGLGAANAQSILQSESDLILQEEVKAALYADSRLNNSIFNVTALDGRVSVTGTLNSHRQSADVKRIAANVDGVRSVTTFLEAPVG